MSPYLTQSKKLHHHLELSLIKFGLPQFHGKHEEWKPVELVSKTGKAGISSQIFLRYGGLLIEIGLGLRLVDEILETFDDVAVP